MCRLILALAVIILIGCPTPALPADGACAAFPTGSLPRIECEYVQARKAREAAIEEQARSVRLGPPPPAPAATYRCADEQATEIGQLEGAPGSQVRAAFRNGTRQTFHEVIVGFVLYDAQNHPVTTIEAAVLPRTIPPGGTGTLAAVLPPPAPLGWSCFRYEITGLSD
jgi:hypothetical protein